MDGPDSVWLQRNAAALATPAQVAERGVAGPFTTPALFGARVRAAGEQVEVVVPHPSGREGWFVLPWSSVLEAFRPSLADRALAARLSQGPITPPRVRAALRAVAAEGLGGRALRRAAAAATPGWSEAGAAALAARLRRVRALADALLAWQSDTALAGEQVRARLLAQRAAATLVPAMPLLAAAGASPVAAERADWLLDGWDLLAALWEASGAEDRVAVVRRMAAVAPGIPAEMLAWPGCAGLAALPALPRGTAGQPVAAARCEMALALWMAA